VLLARCSFLYSSRPHHPALHSFPTRRSSDLRGQVSCQATFLDDNSWFIQPASRARRWVYRFVSRERPRSEALNSVLASLDWGIRSEEHTSELQSPDHLVCRLLLEKKKIRQTE